MRTVIDVEIDGLRARVTVETRDLETHARVTAGAPESWARLGGEIRARTAAVLQEAATPREVDHYGE